MNELTQAATRQWSEKGAWMLMDDLRWAAAAVRQIYGPETQLLAADLSGILESWSVNEGTYSDGTVVIAHTKGESHIYAPPHRRREK